MNISYILLGLISIIYISIIIIILYKKETYSKLWAQPNLAKSQQLAGRVTPNAIYESSSEIPSNIILMKDSPNIIYGTSITQSNSFDNELRNAPII